ncbi:MAG: hemin uptake protein HemP [Pseudomonadota bacterium]
MHINLAKTVEHRPVDPLPLYNAQDLTQGGDLAQIQLSEMVYTLRITRAGKLILTK